MAVRRPASVRRTSGGRPNNTSEPGEIVRALVAQVTGTVRWRESVVFMADAGVSSFYEVGAGKVLSGLIKRLADGATTAAIGSPEEVAAFKAGRNR